MIIHEPEITQKDNWITHSSRIETSREIPGLPKTMWFSFPKKYESWIAKDGNPFLSSMIVPAMYFNENLDVRPGVSPRMAYNLDEVMNAHHHRTSGKLKMIDVQTKQYRKTSEYLTPSKNGSAFTGGVDSFYTFLQNLPEKTTFPGTSIQYSVFIQGFFDIKMKHQEYYDYWFSRLNSVMEENGVELLSVRTNAGSFSHPWVSWSYGYISVISAVSMALGNLFERFYIASSGERPREQINYGSLSCQLLSTESLEIINHSARSNRFERIEILANWKPAREHLRVCTSVEKSTVIENCGRCAKCLRTKIILIIQELDDKFPTMNFKMNASSWLRWLWINTDYKKDYHYLLKYSWAKRKYGIWAFLALSLYPGRLKVWLYNFLLSKLSEERFLAHKQNRTGYVATEK